MPSAGYFHSYADDNTHSEEKAMVSMPSAGYFHSYEDFKSLIGEDINIVSMPSAGYFHSYMDMIKVDVNEITGVNALGGLFPFLQKFNDIPGITELGVNALGGLFPFLPVFST